MSSTFGDFEGAEEEKEEGSDTLKDLLRDSGTGFSGFPNSSSPSNLLKKGELFVILVPVGDTKPMVL